MCIAGLSVSMERKSTIDFATGAFIGEISLVVPKITYIPPSIWVFIDVFLPLLWIGISIMIVGLMSGFLGVHMLLGERLHLEVQSTLISWGPSINDAHTGPRGRWASKPAVVREVACVNKVMSIQGAQKTCWSRTSFMDSSIK